MKRKAEDDTWETSAKRQLGDFRQVEDDGQGDAVFLEDDRSSVYSGTDGSDPTQSVTTDTAPTPLTTDSSKTRVRRRFPSDLKTIQCPNCPKTFNRPARLAAHLRSHTNDRPFKCPFAGCAKDYLEEKHLKQHIKGSHTQERRYVCGEPGCGKTFVTGTRLRRHAAVHEGAERFRCRGFDGCDRSFRKHQTLQRHIRTDHLGQPAYLCTSDGCGAGFDTAGALRRHVDREHGEPRFWCDECCAAAEDEDEGGTAAAPRVGFTTLALLQAHMRREHLNCLFCDARCGGQAQLERHIELHHSGTTVAERKTVACTWPGCPKTFTRRNNLRAHVRTAHEGFRFVCGSVDTFGTPDLADWNWVEEGCGEGFVSRLKLEEHVRFVHLGRERPKRLFTIAETEAEADGVLDGVSGAADEARRNIPCSIPGCPARFIRFHDLRIHVQETHTFETGYEDGARKGGDKHGALAPPLDVGHAALLTVGEAKVDASSGDVEGNGGLDGPFWFGAEPEGLQGPKTEFDREWADMRRLIDVDALMDEQSLGGVP